MEEDLKFIVYNFLYNKNFEKMPYHESLQICENILEAINIISKKGYGDCFMISDFIEIVKNGGFTNYDGFGYFIDKKGNKINDIVDVNYYWLEDNIPKNAKYILWFNK